MKTYKIRKNDKVIVTTGKDKGKVGRVLKLLPKKDRILVEKVNMVKRHTKANPYAKSPGGIVEKEAPMHISNVALLCDACAKPTRVGYKITDDGKKVRYCKKCNQDIDKG
ncbi:50S ribosomal protein L24 [Desulfolutivibrio sulfoxidireducens]|uniref:50S ribosomal protein L24 n=1 Tax=Desulfolutivibrio sulfoxidireducens TaxID=2773299 RepID=UPI00159D9B02|nr:50S ribosomal protein L24 [Desulfolutivibrio sulfoxidireducens]QLA15621.1 50S ribosomal protein L24 [Desulfolutivibrio sulfoxidireducens]QLA19227.1 50S ribosomal protein L24 [Desulfolutivibrio sulfoxidireducens]